MTDLAPLIAAAIEELGTNATRREKVFAVAQVVHRHTGKLPTVQATRAHVVKGSYTDISHDLRDFASTVVTQRERMIEAPGLPDDLKLQYADLLSKLWVAATDKANTDYETEKAENQVRVDDLVQKTHTLEAERLQALTDRSSALEALRNEQLEVSNYKAAVAELQVLISDLKDTVTKLQAHIGEMETDKFRVQEKHDAELKGVAGMLNERDNRLLDLKNALARVEATYEEKITAAQEMETQHKILADAAHRKLETVTNELTTLKAVYTQTIAGMQELQSSRDEAIGKQAIMNNKLLELSSMANKAAAEIEKQRDDIQSKEATIATLNGRIADLETKLFAQKR